MSGDLPVRLDRMTFGLREIAGVLENDNDGQQWRKEAVLCHRLLQRLQRSCDAMRRLGANLAADLEASSTNHRSEVSRIRERLEDGELPYPNSEICPVDSEYGLQVKSHGKPPLIAAFGKAALPLFRDLDEYGSVGTEWGFLLALRAQVLLDAHS